MKTTKYRLKMVAIAVLSITASVCFITILVAQTQERKPNNLNKPKQELQITTRTDNNKKVFKIGEPILLDVNVKNNDKAELFIVQSCISLDYKLSVKNERGQLVSLTKEGQRLTNRNQIICPLKKVKIEPGKTKQATVNLSSLYDMSAKGKYYVSVSRSARKSDNNWVRAESNTIQVIVE